MNPHDYQRDEAIGDDVRSAFDEMFAEARIGIGDDSAPPQLHRSGAMRRLAPSPSRLPLTRAAASVAVLAVGVMIAVAVRNGQGSTPGDGTPIDTVAASTISGSLATAEPMSAATDPGAATSVDTATDLGSSSTPATAMVGGSYDPVLWTYDVATGEVIDRVEPWGTPTAAWSEPYRPPGSDRAYFTQWTHRFSDRCAFFTGKILTTAWPDPLVGADGLPEFDEVTDFGGLVFEFSADGRTMLYDVYPGCDQQPGGGEEIGFRSALRLVHVDTGEEMTLTTRVGADDPLMGGIVDAAITPSGDLVVELGPDGDVYRLTPTDGAVIEDSGVLIARIGELATANLALPRLLSADDSSITVLAETSATTDQSPSTPNVTKVLRGPGVDGTWTELAVIQGSGSADADSHGNLIVVVGPGSDAEIAPGESIPVLRTSEIENPWVQW